MTARFQHPLVNPTTGRVSICIQAKATRPVNALDFRGMAVSPNGVVYAIRDTGQPRVFQDGIAIDADTGMTLVGDGPIANISMGGLGVNVAGALVLTDNPTLIHQGVSVDNAGALATVAVGTGAELQTNLNFEDWADPTVPDGWTKTGTHNAGNFFAQDASGMRFVSDGTSVGIDYSSIIYNQDITYVLEIDVLSLIGEFDIRDGGGAILNIDSVGIHSVANVVESTGTSDRFRIYRAVGQSCDAIVRSCSIKICGAET